MTSLLRWRGTREEHVGMLPDDVGFVACGERGWSGFVPGVGEVTGPWDSAEQAAEETMEWLQARLREMDTGYADSLQRAWRITGMGMRH